MHRLFQSECTRAALFYIQGRRRWRLRERKGLRNEPCRKKKKDGKRRKHVAANLRRKICLNGHIFLHSAQMSHSLLHAHTDVTSSVHVLCCARLLSVSRNAPAPMFAYRQRNDKISGITLCTAMFRPLFRCPFYLTELTRRLIMPCSVEMSFIFKWTTTIFNSSSRCL